MTDPMTEPALHLWADRLEETIRRNGVRVIDRVRVLAETGSTQDAARLAAGDRPGLMVTAGRQSSGRGRLGRAWADSAHLGVAVTFVVEARSAGVLSIAAGLASCRACAAFLAAPSALGLRWPNDVVEFRGAQRKVSGVLIEETDRLALVGIGINVLHRDADWSEALRGRAVSLAQLGAGVSRLEVLERLTIELDRALAEPAEALARAWTGLDILRGSVRTFVHDGREHTGEVVSIDPAGEIVLRTTAGAVVTLPAVSTSLRHE
ncbi:MAG: biotin--[acetyl-CoA-carboxylase] ligase [Planctomycetota bacterium]|nr:biotin--[acetyl-CoA-carboxylase] ligase [Planctomycetota bacterium]